MSADPAPLIVTALLGSDDFAWLDGLRRTHFPPERNHLSAHLTMFHHLPPAILPELKQRLAGMVRGTRPPAEAAAVMNLGRGVAIRILAPALAEMREALAQAFLPLLTPQDRGGWRPHVTIQNKVAPDIARTLQQELEKTFRTRPVRIDGLAIHYYRGGPWETISRMMFRG